MKHQPLAIALTTLATAFILLPTPYKPPSDAAVINNPWGKPIRTSQSLSQPSFTQYDQLATVAVKIVTEPSTSVAGCGDNQWANYIYMHESGCNPSSVNSIGCRGIGQACPGSKLPCGADYACQNEYFTNYANSVYGGWAGAYSFWQSHRWW